MYNIVIMEFDKDEQKYIRNALLEDEPKHALSLNEYDPSDKPLTQFYEEIKMKEKIHSVPRKRKTKSVKYEDVNLLELDEHEIDEKPKRKTVKRKMGGKKNQKKSAKKNQKKSHKKKSAKNTRM